MTTIPHYMLKKPALDDQAQSLLAHSPSLEVSTRGMAFLNYIMEAQQGYDHVVVDTNVFSRAEWLKGQITGKKAQKALDAWTTMSTQPWTLCYHVNAELEHVQGLNNKRLWCQRQIRRYDWGEDHGITQNEYKDLIATSDALDEIIKYRTSAGRYFPIAHSHTPKVLNTMSFLDASQNNTPSDVDKEVVAVAHSLGKGTLLVSADQDVLALSAMLPRTFDLCYVGPKKVTNIAA